MGVEITAIYTSLTGLLILGLAARVARFRHSMKAGLGDKGDRSFNVAIRAHANLVEYAPITLLLLLLAENLGAPGAFLHVAGGVFVVSRLAHAWGFTKASGGYSPGRFWGIAGNWLVILVLSGYNLYAASL